MAPLVKQMSVGFSCLVLIFFFGGFFFFLCLYELAFWPSCLGFGLGSCLVSFSLVGDWYTKFTELAGAVKLADVSSYASTTPWPLCRKWF